MTNTARALHAFWSGFGLPAFVEYDVPEVYPDGNGVLQPVDLPYITYQLVEPEANDTSSIYARVWYRSTSYQELMDTVDQISERIGMGVRIGTDGGYLVLHKESPFAQNMPMDDTSEKVVYLNMSIRNITT